LVTVIHHAPFRRDDQPGAVSVSLFFVHYGIYLPAISEDFSATPLR